MHKQIDISTRQAAASQAGAVSRLNSSTSGSRSSCGVTRRLLGGRIQIMIVLTVLIRRFQVLVATLNFRVIHHSNSSVIPGYGSARQTSILRLKRSMPAASYNQRSTVKM
ncbi:hypothetical protein [Bradyrhizobium sp. 187]|uniref:hypothetical protein n=1 Tax=Bradyrhizobium sp. 187 TaxID=2782655 RepID=UPI001FFF875A|nr:hypothetical protein [Bradyrhizobium sp. 187]UPJ76779.1 hypothetical protein IVB19_38395 [Bradyrhizobium sp. 187]